MKLRLYHSGGEPGQTEQLITELETKSVPLDNRVRCVEVNSNGQFIVVFHSDQFALGHKVTLRNDWDGWTADIQGEFWFGKWIFKLDPKSYPATFKMKFALDGLEMTTPPYDVTVAPDTACLYFDSMVTFPDSLPRFKHGIDNLVSSRTKLQRAMVPPQVDPKRHYDVIVIGSGMGGGVLADQLSDADINTLVLEAGSLPFQTHIDNLPGHNFNFGTAERDQVGHYINRPNSESAFLFGAQMNLGGRSVYWEGLIPRMDRWEANHWPSSVRDYLFRQQGYHQAEQLVRKRRTLGPFQESLIHDLRSAFKEFYVEDLPRALHQPNLTIRRSAAKVDNVLVRPTGVFSTADLLMDSLATDRVMARPYLTINLSHLVTRIETKGNRAVEVVCQDLDGNVERRYQGRYIVLAAGSLESPRIAMASQLEDKNQLIGVGLTDHPAFAQKRLVELYPESPFAGAKKHAKILLRHRDGASHPYTVEILINPRYWDVRHSDDDAMQATTQATDKTFANVKFLFDSQLDNRNRIFYRGPGEKLEVLVHANDSALPLRDEVTALHHRVLKFLQADFDPQEEMDYHSNGTVHHAGGSMRMSEDGTGVVDENLRFLGYENLYCCDVSVFPRIPTSNPALTLVALAQRLAAHLETQR